jgi:hypothetical protein
MPEQLPNNFLAVLKQAEGFVAQEILPRSERMRHGEPLAALGAEVRAASKRVGFFYKTQPEAHDASRILGECEFGTHPICFWPWAWHLA